MNLKNKLSLWEKEKLISAFQHQTILEYEKRKNRPAFFVSVVLLSVFCIGLGIVSLVSANWEVIPVFLKLLINFLLLGGTSYGIYHYRYHKKIWIKEGLILFYSLLIIASIGLIAQIYQLQSTDLRAFFIWCLLTTPLLFMSKKMVLPLIWVPTFFVSGYSLFCEAEWLRDLIYFTNKIYPSAPLIFATICISYLYLVSPIFLHKYLPQMEKSIKSWSILWILCTIAVLDFASSIWTGKVADEYTFGMIITLFIILTSGLFYVADKCKQSNLIPSAVSLIVFFSSLIVFFPRNSSYTMIFGSLLSFISLGGVLFYAYNYSKPRLMNLVVILLAIRFFIVFLQKFGTLLSTGIGLITVGTLFLILTCAVKKFINRGRENRREN